MSAPTDQFTEIATDIATRTQEALTTAVRTWADTVQGFAGTLNGTKPTLPDVDGALDRYFDIVSQVTTQVIDTQRKFAHSVLAAGTQAAETVTEQASKATEQVVAQTVTATEKATEQAKPATKRTAAAKS